MRLAVLDTAADTNRCALTANELLLFEILVVILSCLAILHSSEVGFIALVALVVRQSLHGVALQVVEESISRLLQSRVLV